MSEPLSVSTPVDASQDAVIVDVSVKAMMSSVETYPLEMEMMADSMFVSSASVMERDESITELPSFSVKSRVPLAPDKTGSSFIAEIDADRTWTAEEMAVKPPLVATSMMLPVAVWVFSK